MFRKNEEAVREWSRENVLLCAKRQQEVLANAAKMLLPGGKLVYSTCTFSPEENEQTIAAFLREHEEFEVMEIPQDCFAAARAEWLLPEDAENKTLKAAIVKTRRLWPHKLHGEGHYVALLRKKGILPENIPADVENRKKSRGRKSALPDVSLADDFLEATFDEELCDWIKHGTLTMFGNQLYRLPDNGIDTNGIHILRAGLHIGEFKKNRFEPSHALALAVSKQHAKNLILLSEADERAAAYFRGEAFEVSEEEIQLQGGTGKGWFLMCIDGIPAGWCKIAGGRLKNHYPKGLRKELREKE